MNGERKVTLHGYPVELNDRLYDLNMGWSTVIELNPEDQFSIHLKMDKGGEMIIDPNQIKSLFWQPVESAPPPKPESEIDWSKVPQGTPVVSDELSINRRHYFIAYCDHPIFDLPPRYIVGAKGHIAIPVKYCHLAPGVKVKKEWLK